MGNSFDLHEASECIFARSVLVDDWCLLSPETQARVLSTWDTTDLVETAKAILEDVKGQNKIAYMALGLQPEMVAGFFIKLLEELVKRKFNPETILALWLAGATVNA